MYVLNYFYFLVLTLIMLKCFQSRGRYLNDPVSHRKSLWLSGKELLFFIIFTTGVLSLSAPAGLDLSAIRLLFLLVFCFLLILCVRARVIWNPVTCCYAFFILWISIGILYSPAPMYGVRVVMKYSYGFLIVLAASCLVQRQEVALKCLYTARTVALVSLIVSLIPYSGKLFPNVFWYATALAINYITMVVLSFALYFHGGRKRSDLYLAILFALPCVIWVFRTSIMGTTAALMALCFFRYRLKALPFMAGAFALFVGAVFLIPSVKDKMFYNTSVTAADLWQGKISLDNIDSNGRFAMWEWSLKHFFDPSPVQGAGTGNLQETFYALRHPFGTIRICHNDYVQLLCDNGLVGLVLFGTVFILMIVHSFSVYQRRRHPAVIRICALTAGAAMSGTLLTLYTDNAINYSTATIGYPCAIYGMMIAMLHAERRKRHAL